MSDGDATRRMRDCAQVIADDGEQIRGHHHASTSPLTAYTADDYGKIP
jgi:hypothetical protein